MREMFCRLVVVTVSSGFLAGCGGGASLDVVPVKGTVTYNGSPVAGATVMFTPEEGPIASAVTDLEGRYQLRTGTLKGAVTGEHKVTVSAMAGGDDAEAAPTEVDPGSVEFGQMMEQMATAGEEAANKPKSLIPEKYAKPDTSGLEYTVTDGGDNEYNIQLTD